MTFDGSCAKPCARTVKRRSSSPMRSTYSERKVVRDASEEMGGADITVPPASSQRFDALADTLPDRTPAPRRRPGNNLPHLHSPVGLLLLDLGHQAKDAGVRASSSCEAPVPALHSIRGTTEAVQGARILRPLVRSIQGWAPSATQLSSDEGVLEICNQVHALIRQDANNLLEGSADVGCRQEGDSWKAPYLWTYC